MFTRKENLDRHERKHNNDSFFPCSECGLLKEAVVVVFSLVSIEIVLSSKTLLAYSAGKDIQVFV